MTKAQKEKKEAINRTLNQLSAAARFYALQVKNDHTDVLDTGLSEIQTLLSNCEQLSAK